MKLLFWISPIAKRTTFLVGFNKLVQPVVHLLETHNKWQMLFGSRKIETPANGCKDPIKFVECLVSPSLETSKHDRSAWVIRYYNQNGEGWEVHNQM